MNISGVWGNDTYPKFQGEHISVFFTLEMFALDIEPSMAVIISAFECKI